MSFWSNLGGAIGGGIAGLGSGLINGLFGRQTQNIQNRWQSSENEKNRQFQADEALKAREWQEDFYEMYQSPEAQITSQMAGYKANGINPALMFGGSSPSGGSVPSTSSPVGNASGGASTGSNIVGSLATDIQSGLQMAENLMTQKDRFDILNGEAKVRQAEGVIANMDSELHAEYRNMIRDIFRNDLEKQLHIIENDVKLSDQEVRKATADADIISIERDQMNFENQFLSQKLKSGKTIFQTRLENELRRDINDTKISNIDTKYAAKIKQLEKDILSQDLTQELAESIIANWRKDFIKDAGFDPFGNSPMQSIMSALFANADNDLQTIMKSGSFETMCDKVDEESGLSGWDILSIALWLIPGGKVVKVLSKVPALLKAGQAIFGPTWKSIMRLISSVSKQRKVVKKAKRLNNIAAKSVGTNYDIDYDDLSNYM